MNQLDAERLRASLLLVRMREAPSIHWQGNQLLFSFSDDLEAAWIFHTLTEKPAE